MGLLLVSSCAQEEDIRLDPEGPIWGTPVVKPKGLPLNNGASALIGPDGGSLWYEDLVQLHVPPGAVNEPTLFGIQPINNTLDEEGAPLAFRLTPDDIHFSKPVKLSLLYQAESQGNPQAREIAFQAETGVWSSVSTTLDEEQQSVTVETLHFSDWVWFDRLSLRKDKDKVGAGETVTLKLLEQILGELIPSNHIDQVPLAAMEDVGFSKDLSVSGWRIVSGPGKLEPKINTQLLLGDAVYTAPARVDQKTEVEIQVEVESKNGYIRDPSAPNGRRKLGKLILLTTIQLVPEYQVQLHLHGNIRELSGIALYSNGKIYVRAKDEEESISVSLEYNGTLPGSYAGGPDANQSMFYYSSSTETTRAFLNNFYRDCENEYQYTGTAKIKFADGYAEGTFAGNIFSPNDTNCEGPQTSPVTFQFKIKQ